MDAAILHEYFEYRDGILYWKKPRKGIKVGDAAGGFSSHHHRVSLNRQTMQTHRAIFLMHHGWVPATLDHIDNNPLNNRIENLRPATKSQNACNSKKPKNNTSGVKGVFWNKRRQTWGARIVIRKKPMHLGVYKTLEEAKQAVETARTIHHGEYANHGNN
jgi:hypothetical protein